MRMGTLQFEKEYRVHVYETGPDGKLNLYSLFNYMQDIASDHAEKLGFGRNDLMRDNRFWVLSRMYAVFHKLPLWGNSLIMKTWPDGTDRLFALRSYEAWIPGGKPVNAPASVPMSPTTMDTPVFSTAPAPINTANVAAVPRSGAV